MFLLGYSVIKNPYKGKFTVIEGLDGSGKSTQIELLVEFLEDKGEQVIVTKEPTTDSAAGKEISLVLSGKVKKNPLELQKLFAEDRMKHLNNKVIPSLKEGKIVVSSRYVFSSFAYGKSEGLNLDEIMKMNKNFLLPNITIIVDVLPERCVERIEKRGESKKYFEKIEKLKKVNEFYKKMPGMFGNVYVVNGEKPVREVFEEIKNIVCKIL